MEMWIDETNNDMEKVHEYTDRGAWGSTMNRCCGASDQLITWGSPVATFRWDDTADVDFKNLSVRRLILHESRLYLRKSYNDASSSDSTY